MSVIAGFKLATGAADVEGGVAGGADIGLIHYTRGAALVRHRTLGFITTVAVSAVRGAGGG